MTSVGEEGRPPVADAANRRHRPRGAEGRQRVPPGGGRRAPAAPPARTSRRRPPAGPPPARKRRPRPGRPTAPSPLTVTVGAPTPRLWNSPEDIEMFIFCLNGEDLDSI